MRARLVYQSRKRGTLESDLLLSTFAKEQLPKMSEAELHEFDKVRSVTPALTFYGAGAGVDDGLRSNAALVLRWGAVAADGRA